MFLSCLFVSVLRFSSSVRLYPPRKSNTLLNCVNSHSLYMSFIPALNSVYFLLDILIPQANTVLFLTLSRTDVSIRLPPPFDGGGKIYFSS